MIVTAIGVFALGLVIGSYLRNKNNYWFGYNEGYDEGYDKGCNDMKANYELKNKTK